MDAVAEGQDVMLTIPAGIDVIRLLPPLNASEAEAKAALETLKVVLGAV